MNTNTNTGSNKNYNYIYVGWILKDRHAVLALRIKELFWKSELFIPPHSWDFLALRHEESPPGEG